MNLSQPTRAEIATLHRWRWRPIEFVREVFNAEPDTWQAEALAAFPYSPRLAMKACKGPGKTTVLAWLGWNFMTTRPQPHIGATSINGDNLRDNLWAELSKWHGASPLTSQQFTVTGPRIVYNADPKNWFISARTWPQEADAEKQSDALAGLHADYVMWLCDESGSYPQGLMTTIEQILGSCIEGHVVQSGNPTSLEGPLYRACTTDRTLWKVIEITGDPDDPKRSPRISLEHARQEIARFGRDNPWVLVNILGRFPPASINALLGVEEVTAAMQRKLRPELYTWAQKRLGIDVARFGNDRTVLFPRQGKQAFRPKIMRHKPTDAVSVDIATAVIFAKSKWGSEQEFIDATGGWAAGASDVLLDSGYNVYNVQFASPALDRRYANRRAEMYFQAAKWVKGGGALPNLPELPGEASATTYTFRRGQFVLEEKDQVKARLGTSPDLWDGFCTTFALPEMPAQALEAVRGQATARRDADPFAMPREADPWG